MAILSEQKTKIGLKGDDVGKGRGLEEATLEELELRPCSRIDQKLLTSLSKLVSSTVHVVSSDRWLAPVTLKQQKKMVCASVESN
uniref:Uncharacterized protein n=1 Tax=Vespula pensylvanica TaxID=30213 RepID=A0A834PG52_VESPE|nr:hypothetical protein H0235_001553 [Vespula pensylvanica]